MIYKTAEHWRDASKKRLLFFGMSGLGKTHVANMLRGAGDWYHYSIDYRIGTKYMGDFITDEAKSHAMQVPYLRELLLSDSIYIGSNITFDNLAPLSAYLGKPGDPAKGGLPIIEYKRRQAQHEAAEIAALTDTPYFAERAGRIYGYPNFVCDTGGSICEVVDPSDPGDPVLRTLAGSVLMVWIKGSENHTEELIRRFDKAPKPMSYQPAFLDAAWTDYLAETGATETEVDPNAFIRWTYARALAHRAPRYQAIAQNWGVTITAEDIATASSSDDITELVAKAVSEVR